MAFKDFFKERVFCAKGRKTIVISSIGHSYRRTFTVTFVTKDGGPVSGEYTERRFWWIIPLKPVTGPIQQTMQFERQASNNIYLVSFKTDTDATAEIK